MSDGGLVVHAVVRNRGTERALEAVRHGDRGPPFELVAAGPVAAVVTPDALAAADRPSPEASPDELRSHALIVEALLDRSAVVPLPFGVRARDRDAVEAFLDDQSEDLRKALDFLENAYELRLHVRRPSSDAGDDEAPPGLGRLFEELRVRARSARRLPTRDGTDLSAAFLVPRGEWIRFVERATEWEGHHPGLEVDVTGPWPPYDFVRLEEDR